MFLFTPPFLWEMVFSLLVLTSICCYHVGSPPVPEIGLVGLKKMPLRMSMGARTGNEATIYDTTLITMLLEWNYHDLSQWYTREGFWAFLGGRLLQSWEQRCRCQCLFSFEYSRNSWMWSLQLYSHEDASECRCTRLIDKSCQSENSEAGGTSWLLDSRTH